MTAWVLLAPGPSANAALAERVRHLPLVVVGNAFRLAPWAQYIAAADAGWWRKYPEAREVPHRFCMATVPEVEKIHVPAIGGICNSGVLGLEVAKRRGATRILLLGVDMKGSHFFGQYTNGLRNTTPHQRRQHLQQFERWGRANKSVEVVNCTPGSALKCFPEVSLDACLAELAVHGPGA